jgi:Arm DNA-binding domain
MRGAIVKRGKSWSDVLYLGRDKDGKKRQKWVGGFRTRRDAEEALTQSLDRVRTGTWADPAASPSPSISSSGWRAFGRACGRRPQPVTKTRCGAG